MIDLFGLGKQQEPDEEPRASSDSPSAPDSSAEAAAPRGSHKLWAFLLVLDSLFVIVFAGAVAAKVYQHWKTPEPVRTAPAPKRKSPPPPAPAPAPAPAPTPAPEPAKPAETEKPAEAAKTPAPATASAPRPPKPSMLTEAPRHRETPKPADAGGKSAAPAAKTAKTAEPAPAPAKVKAVKTEFTVRAPKAKTVELVGAFIVRGGRKDMTRQDDGTWSVTLYLNPGSYRYFFAVDKKKLLDPENPHADRGASILAVP